MSYLCHMIGQRENSRRIRRHSAKLVLQSPNKKQEHRTPGGEDENVDVDRRMHGEEAGTRGDSFVERLTTFSAADRATGPRAPCHMEPWSTGVL